MGQAVAADPAACDPGQRVPATGSYHQQVAGAAGRAGQDRAGPSAPDDRADRQVGGRFSPGEVQRVLEPLAGVLGPQAAQLLTRSAPVGQVTIGRQPGQDGHQDGIEVAGQLPRVAQHRALLAGQATDPHPALGHGVVILDASGTVTSLNDAAERWLAQIPESDWPSSCQLPLPLLAAAGHAGEHPAPAVRLRTARGDWLSVHASPLHGGTRHSTVLILEEPGPGELTSLILTSHGVTGAQARVVALVLRGYSTKQIARQLAISQYTIQEHLRAVFDKLGVRSRQELAATLMRPSR